MHERTPVSPGKKPLKDFAIHICTVDLDTGRSLSRPKCIRSSSSGVSEGSHILKRGKYYYLFTAEGGTEGEHSEWVCRSENGPLGPWELGGKFLSPGTGPEDEVQNTGHADVVEDTDGNWWCVFLAVRPVRGFDGKWETSVFGRETFLIPMHWENDWPVFNNGNKISLRGSAKGDYKLHPSNARRDNFEHDAMELGWYRKSTPVRTDTSLTERPGWLRLWGGSYPLGTPASATMWLRKQQHRYVTWETKLDFRPSGTRTEAGAVVWWNYTCYGSIGIRATANGPGRVVSVRMRFENSWKTTVWPLNEVNSEVVLAIECGDQYRLGFREIIADGNEAEIEEGEVQFVASVSNSTMTRDPVIGAAFTGMMLGIYAFGKLEPCLVPADFEYAGFR
jgi:beta-xylosidase